MRREIATRSSLRKRAKTLPSLPRTTLSPSPADSLACKPSLRETPLCRLSFPILACAIVDSFALEFSSVRVTSARENGGRSLLPAKITSSISPALRKRRAEPSPITQRSASMMLDLPQPFGPTTALMPTANDKSTGSANDLKPEIFSETGYIEIN